MPANLHITLCLRLTGAGQSQAKLILDDLSKRGVDIFATCGYDVSRLLALVGDSLRTNSDAIFPQPALWANTHDFLRMHLADNLVYTARAWAPAQNDRGNFEQRDKMMPWAPFSNLCLCFIYTTYVKSKKLPSKGSP